MDHVDVHKMIETLKERRFYGTVELRFKRGEIDFIKKTRFYKLDVDTRGVRDEREERS